MQLALESNVFFWGVEYVATFCCGLLGGLSAVKRGYDFIAIMLTVWLTGLGGGLIRDVLLGVVPPVGVSNKGLVVTCIVAGLAVAVIYPEANQMKWTMLTLDALALGLYSVNGTQKALMYGASGMTACFMGLATALGGGLIRDVLLNAVPAIVGDRHWYALLSAIASMLSVFVTRAYMKHDIDFSWEVALDLVIVFLVVLFRMASVKFDWKVPVALKRTRTLSTRRNDWDSL
ncbi:trimeric intracellular cation channel family protein [Bifidobacterium bombi]|uniref:Membrane protein n=1 Tax=Bifidobacterium bombi DSM 19703 TaxID=1341695 RepID=A0A080N2E3_9BIFI|nr:TRIC cation channel family protein [Bifidobacterium bombi]KFF31132.1 membrane protein [Bifidobacterium bombi DSM 19703]